MTKDEQIEYVSVLIDRVKHETLSKHAKWPAEWDGHDLRELVAINFSAVRTQLMREDKKRKKAVVNEIIVHCL